MRGTPGQRLTSAFSLCVPELLGGQQAVVTGTGREELCTECVWGKVCVCVCVRACFSEVLTKVYDFTKCRLSTFCRLSARCAASSVRGVNKPIVRITCIILKSRNEPACPWSSHRPHCGSWPFALHQRCTLLLWLIHQLWLGYEWLLKANID